MGGLLYTTNIDRPVAEQHDQQLWCHAACLKQHLHPSVPLYVLDLVADEKLSLLPATIPFWKSRPTVAEPPACSLCAFPLQRR